MADLEASVRSKPRVWLVTGAAGFIGSHLTERLLSWGQTVVGADNLSTGFSKNLDEAVKRAGGDAASRFRFLEGDVSDLSVARKACEGVELVLHQAALGSVPRSIAEPLNTHRANVDGFLNMLVAARDAKVRRFVYASSSSVYGDSKTLPKVEAETGEVLSPYGATKVINELYARVFRRCYGMEPVGLRYFNVFGPRQDPNGAYAAVIPKWMAKLASGQPVEINGDGNTSRDFCFVANVVQANLRAATSQSPDLGGKVFNIAVGQRTTLNELYTMIRDRIAKSRPGVDKLSPTYLPERSGDIRDSHANITRAKSELGYAPTHTVSQGLDETVQHYVSST